MQETYALPRQLSSLPSDASWFPWQPVPAGFTPPARWRRGVLSPDPYIMHVIKENQEDIQRGTYGFKR